MRLGPSQARRKKGSSCGSRDKSHPLFCSLETERVFSGRTGALIQASSNLVRVEAATRCGCRHYLQLNGTLAFATSKARPKVCRLLQLLRRLSVLSWSSCETPRETECFCLCQKCALGLGRNSPRVNRFDG